MQTYRLTLQPLSALGTPLAGDTLFGQLCWTLRHQLGNDALTALLAGYTGNLSLEIFNDVFRETPNRRTALDAMRSLLFLESECKNRLTARTQAASSEARAPAATRALQRLDLAAPPAAQPLGGFSVSPTVPFAGRCP